MEFMETWTQLDPLYLFSLLVSVSLLPHLMLSFHSALCPDSDISPPQPPTTPSLRCLGVKYAGLKIFIHFIQTTAKKKKAVLGPGVAGIFSPGPFLQFLRTEKVWGWCPILPGQGMHVITLVRMSLMPFSLDPNIFSVACCVYKQLYQPGFADNSCSFLNLFSNSISAGI